MAIETPPEEVLEAYFEHLSITNRILESADLLHIPYSTIVHLRVHSEEFRTREEEAKLRYQDLLKRELHRRSVEGIPKGVYYQGQRVDEELQYSDRLLELHIKANCPEYREKSNVDLNLKGGVLAVPMIAQSEEEWSDDEEENQG